MSIKVDVQYALPEEGLPRPDEFERWAQAALPGRRRQAELTIRIVDEEEGTRLNETYRHRSGPTNVLSFSFEPSLHLVGQDYLGDLVICAPVVAHEAREQGKDPHSHWAHMVVHGALHLLGHDHADDDQAQAMEVLEAGILARLGYPDPYLESLSL